MTTRAPLSREDFLARCACAFDAGHINSKTVWLLDRWTDFVLRFEGGQMSYVTDFLEEEKQRLACFAPHRTLANDMDAYALISFAAILSHPCQRCATDSKAWHTRAAHCPHKEMA